jgi:biotin operon repressor
MNEALWHLCNEIVALADKLKFGFNSLSTEGRVLDLIRRAGPQTVPGMARSLGTSRQNIQTLVNRLRREGKLVLSDNPAHKRSLQVSLADTNLATPQQQVESEFVETSIPLSQLALAAEVLRTLRQDLGGGRALALQPKMPPEPASETDATDEVPVSLL